MPLPLLPLLAPLLQNGLNLVSNALVAKGKQWVEEKTGVEIKPDMSEENILKLRQFELENEVELRKIALEDKKLDLSVLGIDQQDRKSARDREMAIATSDKAPILNKIIVPGLAILITLLTFSMFGWLLLDFGDIDQVRKEIIFYILGVLSALMSQVINYFFGSSSGSKEKTEILGKKVS